MSLQDPNDFCSTEVQDPNDCSSTMAQDIFDNLPQDTLSDIIHFVEYDDVFETARLKVSAKSLKIVVENHYHFINTFNNRLSSPTWVFQHFLNHQGPYIGALIGVRLRDNATITHRLKLQPPVAGHDLQAWNDESTFHLLDVSGSYFLFLISNTGHLLVKNPFTRKEEEDRVIPLPPNMLFDGGHHLEVVRGQKKSFKIRYCKIINDVPEYHEYNSETHCWIRKAVVQIELLAPEDKREMLTIVENGFNNHVFLDEAASNHSFKRSPILPDLPGEMNVTTRSVYFGRWMLLYTFRIEPGSFFMNVLLTTRNETDGATYKLVSDIPGYLLNFPGITSIQSVSCREIDRSIVVGFKTSNGSYIFSYLIRSGNPGHWNRTDYMLKDGYNHDHSQIVSTNRLTLPVPV